MLQELIVQSMVADVRLKYYSVFVVQMADTLWLTDPSSCLDTLWHYLKP